VPAPTSLGLYALAVIVLLAIPGPAVLYILAQSLEHGRRGGLVAVLGVHAGTAVHIAAATAGVSAIVAHSATAFSALKYAGAAYLVVLGVRRLLARDSAAPEAAARLDERRIFRHGFVVNVLNPKTAVFFLAFLPQFVDPDRGSTAVQALVLGLVFVLLGLISDGAYAVAGGTTGSWLRRHPRVLGRERYVSGAIYVALGMMTALASPSRSK
jgi:threonine/homoserine/homoserine lactone efflux protein